MLKYEMIQQLFPNLQLNYAAEMFDRTATMPIMIFEAVVVLGTIVTLFVLAKRIPRLHLKYGVVLLGVLIFEVFTSPMWNNWHLGEWTYLYRDVSWILTLGWATIITIAIALVDHIMAGKRALPRFFGYLGTMLVFGVIAESIVVKLGIRSYAPEVQEAFWGMIPGLDIPLNIIYYTPVLTALIIGFAKYWECVIDGIPVLPMRHQKLLRGFGICFMAVLLFEIMIEPMVVNAGFPAWSYIHRDISIILTLGWTLIVWFTLKFIDRVLIHWNLVTRFIMYLFIIALIALPIEAWLMSSGHRVYGPAAQLNFTGIVLSKLNVPIEIAFAIPLYFALIIGLIRSWEIALDNHL